MCKVNLSPDVLQDVLLRNKWHRCAECGTAMATSNAMGCGWCYCPEGCGKIQPKEFNKSHVWNSDDVAAADAELVDIMVLAMRPKLRRPRRVDT